MLGGIGGRRRRGQERMRWLDGITDLTAVSLGELRACLVSHTDHVPLEAMNIELSRQESVSRL